MKNGVYYSDSFNQLFVIYNDAIVDWEDNMHFIFGDLPQLSYIGDFWDESAELERYKKVIGLLKNEYKNVVHNNYSNEQIYSLIARIEKEIDCILKCEV